MTRNKWRRTDLNGEIAPDDWILLDPSGEPLARLYKVFGGPQDGRWYWTVLFMPDGSVGNGGSGLHQRGGRHGKPARRAYRKRCAIDDHGTGVCRRLCMTHYVDARQFMRSWRGSLPLLMRLADSGPRGISGREGGSNGPLF